MTSSSRAAPAAVGPVDRWSSFRARDAGGGWWPDLVPALPLLVVCLVGTGSAADLQPEARAPDALGYGLVALSALSLLLRRRLPVAGLVVCGLAVAGYLLFGYPFGPVLFTGPAAAWAVGRGLPWRPALVWVAGFVATVAAAVAPGHAGGLPAQDWLGFAVWTLTWAALVFAGAAIGAAIAARQRSEAGVRAEQARRAVSEERLTMAQDVHDGIGHGLAVIALHSGVALHVLDRDPQQARELLATIQATSREALDGLRAELEQLRSREPAARRPGTSLADLPVLLDRMRSGGLDLRTELHGLGGLDGQGELPSTVDDAAYRIVQESLTNVLRHSGSATAVVRIHRLGEALLVEVRDDGRGENATVDGTSGGTGIPGMRRRAAAVGGSLQAGPAPGRGFVVRAVLPLRTPTSGALS